MRPRSLRLRLLAGATGAIALALGLAWIAMTLLFERHVERQLAAELTRQAVPLVAGLRLDRDGMPAVATPPADPRFALPSSGLYWQVGTSRGADRSRSLWDAALPADGGARGGGWSTRTGDGPFGRPALYVERRVRPDRGGPAVLVQLASDVDALHAARDEFGRELAQFLLLLGAVLAAAAWVQVTLGLRPLGAVRAEVERLRRDPAARLAGRYPLEVAPLAEAIDALAAAREADLIRARRRAADLAHGMKTPLAALAAQSRAARRAGADGAADGLDLAIVALTGTVEAELRRARVAVTLATPGAATPLRAAIERIVEVVEQTEAGERVAFDLAAAEAATAPLREEELLEVLGALVENAARHARRLVRIGGDGAGFAVEDDGPGIDPARADDALSRGGRLDESGGGHGLGLAIARDLVEAAGGALILSASPLGGLKVGVRWPDPP